MSSVREVDYARELAELREKIKRDQTDADFARSEQCHREMRNELMLKREQLPQLRRELQSSNTKIFELNRELERTKSLLKESEFNLKLALKKSSFAEEEIKKLNEACMNLQLKEDMRLSEVRILKENGQKVEYEKQHLSREVEELKDKLRFSQAFQNDLQDRQTTLNALIGKITENIECLQKEQAKITEIDQKLRSSEDFQCVSRQLVEENRKLREKYTDLENAFIETSAKYETLKNFIQTQIKPKPQHLSLVEKIKYLQWEDRCKKLEDKNRKNEEMLATAVDGLNKEVKTNARLLEEIEGYKIRLEELETKLEGFKQIKEDPFCVVDVDG